jgi:hypothetical protein
MAGVPALPAGPLVDWLLRVRPAVLLGAARRPLLAEAVWAHSPVVHPGGIESILPLVRGGALTARADRETAASCTAHLLGLPVAAPSGNLWETIDDATGSEAAEAARHRLAEAGDATKRWLGGVPAARMVQRTYGRHGEPREPWQVMTDVATDALHVVAWNAVSRLVGRHPGAFGSAYPREVWATASAAARAALVPLLEDLDTRAYEAGIYWSGP